MFAAFNELMLRLGREANHIEEEVVVPPQKRSPEPPVPKGQHTPETIEAASIAGVEVMEPEVQLEYWPGLPLYGIRPLQALSLVARAKTELLERGLLF